MEPSYDYGLWIMVAFNVLLFGGFAVGFIRPTKKYEWRTMGVFLAFIVGLFTEMYAYYWLLCARRRKTSSSFPLRMSSIVKKYLHLSLDPKEKRLSHE